MAVRVLEEKIYDGDLRYIEATATSSDTLPEGNFVTGSCVLIVDTKDVKFFNEDAAAGSKWA